MSRFEQAVAVGSAAPSLVRWGCSPDADLVYRMLLSFGPDTVHGLEQGLGTPRRRITAAREELRSAGAVSRSGASARDALWIPRPPAEVVASLRRQRLNPPVILPVYDRERHLVVARGLLPSRVIGEGLRHLASRAAARARMAELVAVARHEHLAMNTEQSFDADAARAALPMDRALLGRGVRMRVLGARAADPDPLIPYGRAPEEPTPDFRTLSAVPMKLIVVDRKVALLPVAPGDFGRGYLEVAQPPIVAALVSLFERNWDAARRTPAGPSTPPLSHRERTLVQLLALGHTDTSAARAMRVSSRTVTNILRRLMDRLGAENRFQLGLSLGAAYAELVPDLAHPPVLEENR